MSLDLRPVQVRLPDDAYEALSMVAAAQDKDLGEVARELLTRMLLGEGHVIRVAAERLSRAVGRDNMRQGAVGNGKAR
jgi:plasmid stability protein